MNIGIIGASDGPTAILVSSESHSFVFGAAVIICIVTAAFIIRRFKKR